MMVFQAKQLLGFPALCSPVFVYIKGNAVLDFCHGAIRPNQDVVILTITISYNPMSKVYQLLKKEKNVHIYIYKYTSLVPGEAGFLRSIQCDVIVAMVLRVVNQTWMQMAWEKKKCTTAQKLPHWCLLNQSVLVFTHPLWASHEWEALGIFGPWKGLWRLDSTDEKVVACNREGF